MKVPLKQEIFFLEDLYQRYKRLMLWTACKLVGHDQAEDIVHDAMVKVIRLEESFRNMPESKRKAYVLLIVHSTALDFKTKQNRLVTVDMDTNLQRSLKSVDAGTAVGPLSRVDISVMLSNLPQQEQAVLIAKYYLGLDSREQGQMLGCSSDAARAALHRARERLYDRWTKAGLCLGDFCDG